MRMSMICRNIKPNVCPYQPKAKAEVDNANWELDNFSYHAKTEFNNCFIIYLKYSKIFNTFRTCVLNASNDIKFFSSLNKISCPSHVRGLRCCFYLIFAAYALSVQKSAYNRC